MKHSWDEIWPGPEAPPDFALRVLVASAKQPNLRGRKIAWLLVALVPCIVLGFGAIALRQHQEEAIKRAAVLEAQRKETEARLLRLQEQFEIANRKERELMAQLANAKDEAIRSKLQAELESQKKATAAAGKAGRPSNKTTKSCSPGDPLCEP